MTVKPWQRRVADRLLNTDPDAVEAEPANRDVTRPPAPQWAKRLAERALSGQTDTTEPTSAA